MNDVIEKKIDNVSASPKARKFARELGINIQEVSGSKRLGRVIEKDIKNYVSSKIGKLSISKKQKLNLDVKKEYDHSEFGDVEIKNIPRIKKIAATHLINSWINIPHVTNHDEADITEIEEFRNTLIDTQVIFLLNLNIQILI